MMKRIHVQFAPVNSKPDHGSMVEIYRLGSIVSKIKKGIQESVK